MAISVMQSVDSVGRPKRSNEQRQSSLSRVTGVHVVSKREVAPNYRAVGPATRRLQKLNVDLGALRTSVEKSG